MSIYQSSNSPWNSQCPLCKNDKAYRGLNVCECPNKSCANYSEKQYQIVLEEEERQASRDRDNEDFLYSNSKIPTMSRDDEDDEYWSTYYATIKKIVDNPMFQGMPYIGKPGDPDNDNSNSNMSNQTSANTPNTDDGTSDHYDYDDYNSINIKD